MLREEKCFRGRQERQDGHLDVIDFIGTLGYFLVVKLSKTLYNAERNENKDMNWMTTFELIN